MSLQIVTKSAEVRLMEMLNNVSDSSGWQGVHFHLNGLLEQYKSEYQIKIAMNLVNDLLKDYDGGVFLLADSSIVVLCHGLDKPLRNKLIFQLRYLYMDDPLAYTEDGSENPEFCTAYDLRHDWQEFMETCTRRMAMAVRKSAPAPSADAQSGFSASGLANVERDLDNADIHRVIRQQAVCAILPKMPVKRVFDELYIRIAHLRQILKADVDFLSNRWLFKYLTRILDQRMIELIRMNPARHLSHPVSLNLNVETLLSSVFEEFDAVIKPETKVSIVIEVPVIDVFADMKAFLIARQAVQKLGYRVCLDGVTAESFVAIDRAKLGLDLVKVQWNADVAASREMAEAVKATGANRVILCRCDNKQAVEYGQALGISLFQGRYIDGLLDPLAKIEN